MTEGGAGLTVVARVVECGQYGVRVELPDGLDATVRREIAARSFRESTEAFLKCTARFQAVAWAGDANLAFAENACQPSDRKSKFLHHLLCLKMVELSAEHHRQAGARQLAVTAGIPTPRAFRLRMKKLCKGLGIAADFPEIDFPEQEDGGDVDERTPPRGPRAFRPEWVVAIEQVQTWWLRKFSERMRLKNATRLVFAVPLRIAWAIHTTVRGVFQWHYRKTFRRVVANVGTRTPVFPYFESRSGRHRDVGGYLKWKFGTDDGAAFGPQTALVPFTHFSRARANYSFAGMAWALQSLRRLERDPAAGCVVVTYLPKSWRALKQTSQRRKKAASVKRQLLRLKAASPDLLHSLIYEEFRTFLSETDGYGVQLVKSYQTLFSALPPGVVLQADALAKGARLYTSCARRRGGRAIYLADKVGTPLRTSNQLIADAAGNSHFPDRCVIFDAISREELLSQRFPADRLHHYHRSFSLQDGSAAPPPSAARTVLIVLQDYLDHLDALLLTGAAIARDHPDLHVVFQEHPDFPVPELTKVRFAGQAPGRLRFLEKGAKADPAAVLAVVTGYSTAAIPWVLRGAPLIWLRDQVDNSIYGEAYLSRVGFASDSTAETSTLVGAIHARKPEILAMAAAAGVAARELFEHSAEFPDRPLSAALREAVEASLEEIRNQAPLWKGDETIPDRRPPMRVFASIVPCAQYGYRVELADASAGVSVHRAALRAMTATFLECTRQFQTVAWAGCANLAFGHHRFGPQDSSSGFLHGLTCLKTLELAFANLADREGAAVQVSTAVPLSFRDNLKKLGAHLRVKIKFDPASTSPRPATTAGGGEGPAPFDPEWLVEIEALQTRGGSPASPVRRQAMALARNAASAAHCCVRLAFHLRYRAAFRKIAGSRKGGRNLFLFFESRSGRNREVPPYLTWKYGRDFLDGPGENLAAIPFTHFSRQQAASSRAAMAWALNALRRLESDPLGGCVTVNFLLPPRDLWRIWAGRHSRRSAIRARLEELRQDEGDFLARTIYEAFRSAVATTDGHSREIAESYRVFFNSFPPGVVLQADAIARGARQFMSCACQRGGRVVYAADRICTELRTSNQLIPAGEGDPHFPARHVIFDQTTRGELLRQGVAAERIHGYRRSFGTGGSRPEAKGRPTVLVFLQAYEDNMDAMLATGAEVAAAHPTLDLVFQEHPHFPVPATVRNGLAEGAAAGNLRFLARGESPGGEMLAVITGYSTAVIPWILQGVPLVWLRGQVANAAFCEEYLARIGFASDSGAETVALIGALRAADPGLRAAQETAVAAVRELFEPATPADERSLAAALREAVEKSFAEIGGAPQAREFNPSTQSKA